MTSNPEQLALSTCASVLGLSRPYVKALLETGVITQERECVLRAAIRIHDYRRRHGLYQMPWDHLMLALRRYVPKPEEVSYEQT